MSKFAWVTLTTNDTYSLGALVLAHSLKRTGTAHQLAVLVTPGVSESMRSKLKDVYNIVQDVDVMDSKDAANLALLARPELGVTFTKLHCWRLIQFEKCVFLDADTLVLQNCDELFEREELSAAPDVSWPDCFNSGVFVFKPSLDTFAKITEFAIKNGSFDGGDQGLLNSYFADWAHTDISKHLPFTYNVTAYASYCYLPAFKQFRKNIKILHFAGKMKPWLIQFNSESKTPCTPSDYSHAAELIQLWWNIFCDNVHPSLTDNMNYWPGICCYEPKLESNQKSYHQHNPYQNHNDQEPHSFNLNLKPVPLPQHFEIDLDNIKEYCDPWEDYYDNLEKQNNQQSSFEPMCEMSNDLKAEAEQRQGSNEEVGSIARSECDIVEMTCHASDTATQDNVASIAESLHECQSEAPSTDSQTNEVSTNVTIHTKIQSSNENTQNSEEIRRADTAASGEEETLLNANSTTNHTNDLEIQQMPENEAGLAGALSQLRLGSQRTPEQQAYEELMRRQCWESGQIDYAGKDSFENIWKKITQTLEERPAQSSPATTTATTQKRDDKSELLTSADIEDGKIEYDSKTRASTQYKLIEGGYEMIITTPQPNGTVKTQVKTFWDPKPVSEEDMRKEASNKKLIKSRIGKEIRIDRNTTMLTREIEGGYEEVYTVVNEDGTKSMRTKTFFDSVPDEVGYDGKTDQERNKTKKTLTKKSSVDSTDSTESRKTVQKVQQQKNLMQNVQQKGTNYREESTTEESRRVTQNIEITENNRTVRKNSVQEQNVKAITQSSNMSDSKDLKKKKKSKIPPPPPDFLENDTTTVTSKRVPGGVQYTYSTELESGKTITTTKNVYEEEDIEMTEEEIRAYKKTLKDAEKFKNVTTNKKLRSESGTKKIVPSENPGDVTTVETIKIEGGTEYHYTTVTAEGIVKKAVKTVYDPVATKGNPEDTDEEEIVEEYEEEVIEPGEKNIRTVETIKKLPQTFQEEVTITHEKKEKKVKKSMMISH